MAGAAANPMPLPLWSRAGLTLIEFMVLVLILSLLGGLAGMALAPVIRYATATRCMSNLRQVGMACTAYADDWSGILPAEGNLGVDDPARSPAWFCRLPPYVDADRSGARTGVFQCGGYHGQPAKVFTNAMPKSFKMNSYLDNDGRPPHYTLGAVTDQSEVVLFVDAVAKETGMGQWGHAVYSAVDDSRHRGIVNVLFCDGHSQARVAPPKDLDWKKALRWRSEMWK